MRALSLLAFLALAGSATAAVIAGGGSEGARASAISAAGSFSFANSRDGMPIFSAAEIAPGDSASGTVEIASSGSEPGELVVAQHDVSDTPGASGGMLSARLTMRITDVTAPGEPVAVYSGPLSSMPPQAAGVLAAGESRSYEFVATLPAGGAEQNDVQGASASVGYRWTAREPVVEPEPPVDPPQPPATTPTGGSGGTIPQTNPPPAPLSVTLTRARHTIRNGRLLVWARCEIPCAVSAKGRLRARASDGRRAAKLRLNAKPRYRVGVRPLPIRIPRSLRTWLREHPEQLHLRARLTLRAKDPSGRQAAARRSLRLRSAPVAASSRDPGRGR